MLHLVFDDWWAFDILTYLMLLYVNNYRHLFIFLLEVNFLLEGHFGMFGLVGVLGLDLTIRKLEDFLFNWFSLDFFIKIFESVADWYGVDEHFAELKLFCLFFFFLVDLFKTGWGHFQHGLGVVWVEFFNIGVGLSKPTARLDSNHHTLNLILLPQRMMSFKHDCINFPSSQNIRWQYTRYIIMF